MSLDIVKVIPYFSEKIWGGSELKKYGFEIGDRKVGEAWLISAHPNGMSYVNFNNNKISLIDFYNQNKSFFGYYNKEFPILAKIITANDYLSVQVHPSDEYAKKKHNSLGKPESWYIMDCKKDSNLIYGHNASSLKEFEIAIKENKWNDILKKEEINVGDFLYVEPGKIHAITPNVTVFELQRSSDITYRLYDYDRLENNKKRELHIEDSLNNISVPDSDDFIIRNKDNFDFESEYFLIKKLKINGSFKFEKPNTDYWINITIINGEGVINGVDFKCGESAVCNSNVKLFEITGKLEIIFYWVNR
ncbi:mannose-6-phosphate isomerase [Spiroplasma litorale]|uniref:Mannose-6-phosphate isomerase n=1 Tax=Spiroplasma litorale TaxID=216942 RepID=A0A0K1W0M9_9MOLU|nr:type I phosphomannose isomerase catalytic subunit [Spiroplasma litorale]AKX33746.1 mannose-6-phosphate isomerase [Spiroplasma litorale]